MSIGKITTEKNASLGHSAIAELLVDYGDVGALTHCTPFILRLDS